MSGKKSFKLEDFIIFVASNPKWIKNAEIAHATGQSESTVSRQIGKAIKNECFQSGFATAIAEASYSLACMLGYNNHRQYPEQLPRDIEKLLSKVELMLQTFELLPAQQKYLQDFKNAIGDATQDEVKAFINAIDSLIKSLDGRPAQKLIQEPAEGDDFITVITECKEKVHNMMDEYMHSEINNKSHFNACCLRSFRKENIYLSNDLTTILRVVLMDETFCKKSGAEFTQKITRTVKKTQARQTDEELAKQVYEELDIRINGKTYSEYWGEPRIIETKVERKERDLEYTHDVWFEIPIKKEDTKVQIKIYYKSYARYEIARSDYTYRLKYPTKSIHHMHRILGGLQTIATIPGKVFEPFFSRFVELKDNPDISVDKDLFQIKSDDWHLPGAGYIRWIQLKDIVLVDNGDVARSKLSATLKHCKESEPWVCAEVEDAQNDLLIDELN